MAASFTLAQIADAVRCPPPPPDKADHPITGVAALDQAGPTELSFLVSDHFHKQFAATSAAAVLVDKKTRPQKPGGAVVLRVDDADLAISRVLELFAPPTPRPVPGVHPSALVDPSCRMGDAVAIGPLAIIGPRCRIGARTIVHGAVYLGEDVIIGEDCQLFPHVTVRERITIGNRVIIHANSVLGTDGFGYRWDGSRHAKIPQIGTVVVEDDVEIGSGSCVDRAKFGITRVGRGTKIDNLVQIGHNANVGPHCILVGQSGLAGSARLGAGVVIGGQSGVREHIYMADGSMAASRTGVADNVKPGTVVSGMPAIPHRQSLREQAALRRLPDLLVQVRKLQEDLDKLKGA